MKITEEYININNSRQNIMIACKNAEYPVLLILHGGGVTGQTFGFKT